MTNMNVSIDNISDMMEECCSMEKSGSFDDDSYTVGSSSSYHSDDSSSFSIESDGQQEQPDHSPSAGLYLSSAMQNLLRGSAGSDTDLPTVVMTQDPNLQKMASRRRGSLAAVNTPESKIVYVLQTKSATENDCNEQSPLSTLLEVLKSEGLSTETRPAQSLPKEYWTEWNTDGYTAELATAIRQNDLDTIQKLAKESHNLQCCNRFGESIVHTAARRGSLQVLEYLIDTAGVSLHVCCDNGRTPLQDACWTGRPNFDVVRFLLQKCPEFLLLTDKRGLTPLEYVPKDTWGDWNTFLKANPTLLSHKE